MTTYQTLEAALTHHQAGRLDEAKRAYQEVLRAEPKHPDALHLLGVVAHQSGDNLRAVEYIKQAIQVCPSASLYHNNLGMVLQALAQLPEAAASYREALRINPQSAEAHNNLGITLYEEGRLDDAITCYLRALSIRPEYPDACTNLGNALQGQAKYGEAAAAYRRALTMTPQEADTHYRLATVLLMQDKCEEAAAAAREAVALSPDTAKAHATLGSAYRGLEDWEQAEICYRQAARLQPDMPEYQLRAATLWPTVFDSREQMDECRARFEAEIERFAATGAAGKGVETPIAAGEPPFALQFLHGNLRPIKEAYARAMAGAFEQWEPPYNAGMPRVGIVVTHGHESVFLRSLRGMIEEMDPSLFEITVFCSPAAVERIRYAIRRPWVSVVSMGGKLVEAAQIIRQTRCDVLYYREVGTDLWNYYLPFYRLAPVQCTSFGIQVTSGIATLDYYLSSRLVESEEAQAHYSEKLELSETLLPMRVQQPPLQMVKRPSEFGLDPNRRLYLCPHQLGKFHPDFDRILGNILRRDEAGVLGVLEMGTARAVSRLQRRFQRTMADVADRVVFLPKQKQADYLALIAAADVLLDPIHFGGMNTSYDGFSFHQPIVTLPTAYHRGRYTLGCYRKMEIDDCIARDEDDYVDLAVRLGMDREYRRHVVEKIRQAAGRLFEDRQTVREHERIFLRWIEAARRR
ncbi:MAG: tetratricopeptide repeat protein [Pirellulales bacterium]|nr:tetratricopeptide repeat protein [Pirellulales bacterium]